MTGTHFDALGACRRSGKSGSVRTFYVTEPFNDLGFQERLSVLNYLSVSTRLMVLVNPD